MKCEYCGVNITEGFLCAKHRAKVDAGECNCDEFSPTCTYCQIREKEEHERTQAELARLRAANAELVEALEKLARLGNGSEYGNSDGNMIARSALSRAEQARSEPETKKVPEKCVWVSASKPMVPQAYKTSCGMYRFLDIFFTGFCPDCGKRVEVKE